MTFLSISTQPGHQHMLAICGKHCLKVSELRGPEKLHAHAKARRELWFRLVILEGFTLPEAARLTGRRHHTTVLYGLRRYSRERFRTPPKATLSEIRAAHAASQQEIAA